MSEVQLFADPSVVCPSCQATGLKAILVRPHRWPQVLGLDARVVMGILGVAGERFGRSERTRKGWGALRKAAMEEVVAQIEEGEPGPLEEPADRFACTACGHVWSKAAALPLPEIVSGPKAIEPSRSRHDDVVLVHSEPKTSRLPGGALPRVLHAPILVSEPPSSPPSSAQRRKATRPPPLPLPPLPRRPASPSKNRAQRRATEKVLTHRSRLGVVRWHAVRGRDFTQALGVRCACCGAGAGHLCRIQGEGS